MAFRNEWKLSFLGQSIALQDFWLSTHSKTHYAAYIWQPHSNARRGYDTTELLLVWDISESSQSRPSDAQSVGVQPSMGPRLVKSLVNRDLEFLTVRQHDTPSLRKIVLDDSTVYFFEEGCDLERGLHVCPARDKRNTNKYWERVVGIPILGPGPRWEDERDVTTILPVSTGPTGPTRATCWRWEGIYPGVLNKMIHDEPADIQFRILQQHVGVPEVWVSSNTQGWDAKVDLPGIVWRWKEVYGDERWLIMQSKDDLYILRFDWDRELDKGSHDRLLTHQQGFHAGTFPKNARMRQWFNY